MVMSVIDNYATTRENTAPRSPDASKAAEPDGTAPQPPSNAGAATKSANGNPAADATRVGRV